MAVILLFLAILPTIVLGTYIYRNDKVEKEPVPLLVKLSLSGVVAVILTLTITQFLQLIVPFFRIQNTEILDPFSLGIYVFIGIALIEEFSKWFFTYLIAWKDKAFNHVYDAIVYSVFVSLGFATIENILYIFGSENLASAFSTAFVRMIFSVPGHAFFGVIMGYYLGLSKLTSINNLKDKSSKFLKFSLLIPTFCHFLFDYLLMISVNYEIFIFLFFIFTSYLFKYGISRVKRLSDIPTYLFNDSTDNNYVYYAFGNKPSKIRFCSNCGAEIKGKYCTNCGKRLF